MNLNLRDFILAVLFTRFFIGEFWKNLNLLLAISAELKFISSTKINEEAE